MTVAALLALSACSSGGGGDSADKSGSAGGPSEPLRVFMVATLGSAGGLTANGQTEVMAAKAAVDTINAAGGIDGQKIELTVESVDNDPTTTITKLQAALNGANKPTVYINAAISTVAGAVLPIATQNKMLSFNISPTADSGDASKFPYNFDLSPSTKEYASAFCPEMKKNGYKTFGIVYNETPFAESNMSEVTKQCTAAGMTMVAKEKFKTDALDVTPQMLAVKEKNPDVLVVSAYGSTSGYVLQARDKLGWDVPVLGDNAFMVSPVITQPAPQGMLGSPMAKKVTAEVFQSTVYRSPAEQPKALTNMLTKMKAQGAIPAPIIVGYPYDAIILAAAAAKAAGSTTDGAKIAKAVETLPAGKAETAIFPVYNFTSSSHSPNLDESAFIFTAPTKVIDGQFGAPGA